MTEKEYQDIINKLKNSGDKLVDALELRDSEHKLFSELIIQLFGLYHKNRDLKKTSQILLLLLENPKNQQKLINLSKKELQRLLYCLHFALGLEMNRLVEEYRELKIEYDKLHKNYSRIYRQLELQREQINLLYEKLNNYIKPNLDRGDNEIN